MTWPTFSISTEIQYLLLLVGLFIVPRFFQRYRIPSAVTCVVIGAVLGITDTWPSDDETTKLLATLGIVSMFLFAGLEVDFHELREGRRVLVQHVLVQLVILAAGAAGLVWIWNLDVRAALLLVLALFTPSTGFILDSLHDLELDQDERFWVKSKAIASELVALAVLFFTVQSADIATLGISALALAAMAAILPLMFHFFMRFIAPFAPRNEFTFLVMVALMCAFVTRQLGVYYLVGAFVVGLTAVRMRRALPGLSSEKLMTGVELFASFFIPFYFFKAGLHVREENFTWHALYLAMGMLLVVIPSRVIGIAWHRRWALGESFRDASRIGAAVLPTLVFTLVIAEILKNRFGLSPEVFGALIIFTLINTLIPGLILRLPAIEFDTPLSIRSIGPGRVDPRGGGAARSSRAGRLQQEIGDTEGDKP